MPVLPPQGPQFLQNEPLFVHIFRLPGTGNQWKPDYSGVERDARVWLCTQGGEAWPYLLVQSARTGHVQTAQEFMDA